MDVDSIIARVAEFALDENDASTNLNARILADINSIYQEVTSSIIASKIDYDDIKVKGETITLVSGVGTLANDYYALTRVKDEDNKRFLTAKDKEDIEIQDPSFDATGNPNYYYTTGSNTFECYPVNSGSMKVYYYKKSPDLVVGGAESTVLLPAENHEVLVAGGIYKMYIREQGFHNRNDRSAAFGEYERQKELTLNNLRRKSSNRKPVEYYDF